MPSQHFPRDTSAPTLSCFLFILLPIDGWSSLLNCAALALKTDKAALSSLA